MTIALSLFCLIIAVVIFAVAAWWSPPRGNLIAAGLFFATLSLLLQKVTVVP